MLWQTRGRKAPSFGWATFGWATLRWVSCNIDKQSMPGRLEAKRPPASTGPLSVERSAALTTLLPLNCELNYVIPSISFQILFVQAFKIVLNSWKSSMLLLYTLWDDWPIFSISGSNEQLQQELEYTLLHPDCHSRWISKMKSGREDTLEEQDAITFCFKLEKNTTGKYGMLQTAFRPSCMNRASVIERHKRFKEGREPVRDGESCGKSK